MPENRSRDEREVELRPALAVPLTRLHGYGSAEVEKGDRLFGQSGFCEMARQ
jgi:hypothetical protein